MRLISAACRPALITGTPWSLQLIWTTCLPTPLDLNPMFMHSRTHGSRSSAVVPARLGFTLTDLSVALALLSVLAVIVVPMMIKAKANTKLAQCVANLQQV